MNFLSTTTFIAILIVFNVAFSIVVLAQQQDPMTLNGGSVLAMTGKGCVAVAVDKRFGFGNKLVNICRRPVFIVPSTKLPQPPILQSYDDIVKTDDTCSTTTTTIRKTNDDEDEYETSNVMVAFTGLEGDIQSLIVELSAQINSKLNRGLGFARISNYNNGISPATVASLTSHILYQRKRSPYYVEPIVIGLEKVYTTNSDSMIDETTTNDNKRSQSSTSKLSSNHRTFLNLRNKQTTTTDPTTASVVTKPILYHYRPFLCSMDIIGAKSNSKSFSCSGAASKSLMGTAEAYWRPNLSEDELVETCCTAFLSALERDCLSGYGATIYLITSNGTITEYDVESRSD